MTAVYRYFSNDLFCNQFLDQGTIFFNSLSYFLDCEDLARRDKFEDVSIFAPNGVLLVNNISQGTSFTLQSHLTSSVRKSHRIFVYCTSLENSETLMERFGASSCIRIDSVDEFVRRIKKELKSPLRRIADKQIIHGPVSYYHHAEAPGTRHALPDEIVLSKRAEFSVEQEYRIAFAVDRNAFDAYNVDYHIGSRPQIAKGMVSHRKLQIGSLRDICTDSTPP